MKQFMTAIEESEAPETDEGIPFDVDGVMCHCFRPTGGQLAVFMATTGRMSSTEEKIAGIINFFASVLDERSNQYIVGRLLDRRDRFDLPQVEAILQWMIEEWTARPTQRPSGSTPSPPSTGNTLTPTTHTSI